MQLISRKGKIRKIVQQSVKGIGQAEDHSYENLSKNFQYGERMVNPQKLLKFKDKVVGNEQFKNHFVKYTNKILPTIESQLENEFIQKWIDKVDNHHVKKLIMDSYLKRKLMVETRDVVHKEPKNVSQDPEYMENIQNLIFSELDYCRQSIEDVGLFTEITEEELQKYFDINYEMDKSYDVHLEFGNKMHVQNTKESFIMSELIRFNYIDISEMKLSDWMGDCKSDGDIELLKKELLDETTYLTIFKILSSSLIDELRPYRGDIVQVRLFSSPHLFEKLVTVVLMQMRYQKFRDMVFVDDGRSCFKQILQQVFDKIDPVESNGIYARKLMKKIGCFNLEVGDKNHKIDLMECLVSKEDKFRPKRLFKFGIPRFHGQNSGILMWGQGGSGKSWFLNYLNMYNVRSENITLYVQSAKDWTQYNMFPFRRYKNGLYLQFDQAVRFLNLVKRVNKELLESIPVDLSIYGMINITGVHKNDVEPVPNTYDERRQVHFNESDNFLYDFEIQEQVEWEYNLELILISRNLKQPNNLMEIVQYGIDNKEASINAIGELLEQLYNLKSHQTVILIDEYNWFFRPSGLESFRYENDRKLNSKIPPSHLALCRLFMNFDGHRMKNGYKICASGTKSLFNHQFNPSKIYFGNNYDVRRDGLEIQEYYNFIEYLKYKRIYEEDPNRQNPSYNQIYMESQGNQFETMKLLEGGAVIRRFRR